MPKESDQGSSDSPPNCPNGTPPSNILPTFTANIRELLKQRQQKRLRRKMRSVFHIILCRLIPLLMLILGIIFCCIGGSYNHHLLLSIGCVLLICSAGLVLQSCFWSRSQPNKFTINEIIRSGAGSEEDDEDLEAQKSDFHDESNGQSEKNGSIIQEPVAQPSTNRISKSSLGLLEVRRLSLAMTRVATELRNAANDRVVGLGPTTFARGPLLGSHTTALAPTDYERGAINWYGNFTSSELTHMRRLSQWQNFV